MIASSSENRVVSDLIGGKKADAKSARGGFFPILFIGRRQQVEAVEITQVPTFGFPQAGDDVLVSAVTENRVVLNN